MASLTQGTWVFEQTRRDSEGQGSLACCSSWGRKESDMTERLNWTERKSRLTIHWKDWCWSSSTLATWFEELTHWKRPWWWESLKGKGEEGGRGWDGWVASPTERTEFELASEDSEGQGSLACCSPWSRKKSDMTEQRNNNKSVMCLGISKYHQNQFTSICTTYSLCKQQEEKKLFKRQRPVVEGLPSANCT